MAINAIPLGFNTPLTQDIRNQQSAAGAGLVQNIADAQFDSGRCLQILNNTQGGPRHYQDFEDSGVLAVGDSLYVRWEHRQGSVGGTDQYVGMVQGNRLAAWQGYDGVAPNVCQVGLSVDVAGNLTITVRDANAAQGTTANGAGLAVGVPGVRAFLALKITLTSATAITVTPYKDDIAGTPWTHNNAGGVGAISFQTFRFGMGAALAKGASCDIRVGNVFVSGTAMPGLGDKIAYQLPNAMGATNQWFDHTGIAAAANSEWNDAFGAYSAASFNTTNLVLILEKANATFPALALSPASQVICVGMNATSSFNGTTFDNNRVVAIDAGGVTVEKDIAIGKAALETNGAQIRYFATRGDGTPWTPAAVDADAWYVKQPLEAGTREFQCSALGQMVWYRLPGPAVRTRRQRYFSARWQRPSGVAFPYQRPHIR